MSTETAQAQDRELPSRRRASLKSESSLDAAKAADGASHSVRDQLSRKSPRDRKDRGPDEDELEVEDEKQETPLERLDEYVCFTNNKDLTHYETISIKAQNYKGISVKVKILNHIWIENLLFAIEKCPDQGIVYLKFEECKIMKRAVQRLIQFCQSTKIITSFGLVSISFDDEQDFKKLVEAVAFNQHIKQFIVQKTDFDDDYHGKTMAKCILESKSLVELDLSYVTFEPKSFYEMANGLLNERCRLQALKLKGINFGQLEGKVMQFVLMRNKSLTTLDLSECSADSAESLENMFEKFHEFCNIRTLVIQKFNADFNYVIEAFGFALSKNHKLEGLCLKDNRLKQTQYCNFWELLIENKTLRQLDIAKTEVTDKVCTKIAAYLEQQDIHLIDLNLSRNLIGSEGLIALSTALAANRSLRTLNLAQNNIKEGGVAEFALSLKVNETLQELCLSFNKINNQGLTNFVGFLEDNTTLKVLDISKNTFADAGFSNFSRALARNKGIESLNLQKNKDVTDEVGLKELALSLASNSSLKVIDLSGIKVRKPCMLQFFQPSLKRNITLKKIVGKIPPNIITGDLKDNVTIEERIIQHFRIVKKEQKRELAKVPVHRTDEDQTQLHLRDFNNELLLPALKLIKYKRIHVVDLSNIQLEDEQLRHLSLYVEDNPPLRSLGVAQNFFSDEGLIELIHALRRNTHLNHINLQQCSGVTERSLMALEEMVTQVNMSLYNIEITETAQSAELFERIAAQALMNRAIQESLKPVRVEDERGLVEIQFQGSASLCEHFPSALKAWRILGPNKIQVLDKGIRDEHVEQLCQFLWGRNQIRELNLRRNKIGNAGAQAIARLLKKADKAMVSLDLERNEIGDEGGEALLAAVMSNMRVERCKVGFGNPMKQKICRQIEREMKANNQIKGTIGPQYKKEGHGLQRLEETDRGPDFVRCALKASELFKLKHLSLPDNMIGEKEMNDIAYFIQKNTPLQTLDLSDNVIDAKASLLLARALRQNSHLKVLTLRNNRMGNAGIALLMEIFVLQGLQKEQVRQEASKMKLLSEESEKRQNAGQAEEAEAEGGLEASPAKPDPEKMKLAPQSAGAGKRGEAKKEKFRMKIEKLILDQNQQSEDGLKHVFTVLIANPTLAISIDFPRYKDRICKTQSDSEEEELLEQEREKNAIRSLEKVVPLSLKDSLNEDSEAEAEGEDDAEYFAAPNEQVVLQKQSNSDQEVKDNKRTKVLKKVCCKSCFYLIQRGKGKSRSWDQICCSNFLKARMELLQFKMSWDYIVKVEKSTAPKLFVLLVIQILVYFSIGAILPFLGSFLGQDECSQVSPYFVYYAYGWFFFTSTVMELVVLVILRHAMTFDGVPMLPFNRYLFVKWWQGQFSNFVYFMHFCYVAANLMCLQTSGGIQTIQNSIANGVGLSQIEEEKDSSSFQSTQKLLKVISSVLAIIAAPILVVSNVRRIYLICKNFKRQPDIHKILPNMQRNTQLAWLLNFQATAVALESTSLSDYIFANGGPIIPGKPKDLPENFKYPKQEIIYMKILKDKMLYQDIPMLAIMTIQFFATFGPGINRIEMIINLVQISCTFLAILSAFVSMKYNNYVKGVNLKQIRQKVEERLQEYEQKVKEQKKSKKKVTLDMTNSQTKHTQSDIDSQTDSQGDDEIRSQRSDKKYSDDQGENQDVEVDKDKNDISLLQDNKRPHSPVPVNHENIDVNTTTIQDKGPDIQPGRDVVSSNELSFRNEERDKSMLQEGHSYDNILDK